MSLVALEASHGGKTTSTVTEYETKFNFDHLLSRADDYVLQQIVGGDVVRLLRHIDPALATPARLRILLSQLRKPTELLRERRTRALLLDLLSPSDAEALLGYLGVPPNGNPFIALGNLAISKGSRHEERLFSFFGQTATEETGHEQNASAQSANGNYQLFQHQRRAVSGVQEILASDRNRVLLHMPTGSGKTRTAMNIIAEHLRTNEPTLVVWLAYSEELCEQAIEEFSQAWDYLGNRTISVLRFWSTYDLALSSVHDGFLVAGLGKVYNYGSQSIASIATLADRVSLVIVDEAHQAIAPTYRLVLDALVEKKITTGLLGLSATPGRTWNDIDKDQELASFFQKQKVSLEISGYDNPIEYLIKEGYLARPKFSPLFYDSGNKLSQQDLLDLQNDLDIPARLLERLAKDEQRNLRIVLQVEQAVRFHKRIILFAASVTHAKLLAAILQARGIVSEAITAETARFERQRIITGYRGSREESMVLCNYGVLTAGFDAPQTSAAIIARPTKSLVLYSQMIGRALRGPLAGGNQKAEIITVVDTNLPGFGDLAESFLNWEDVWV